MDGYHEVKKEHRALAKKGDFEWTGRAAWLSCALGVWDGRKGLSQNDKYQIIVKTERRNKCYFWPYAPGQSLSTAENLQAEKGSEGRHKANYRVAVISVIVALCGVLIAYLQLKP